jgi:hypothetical protein
MVARPRVTIRPTRFNIEESTVQNQWLAHLGKILAGLTALASLGELAHLFDKEWIVFVLALATFVSEFFKPQPEVVPTVQPPPPVAKPK